MEHQVNRRTFLKAASTGTAGLVASNAMPTLAATEEGAPLSPFPSQLFPMARFSCTRDR